MFDGDVRMVYTKSGLISEGFCRSIDDCRTAVNITGASTVEGFVEREPRCMRVLRSGMKTELFNNSGLLRGETNRRNEIWAGNLLLLIRCSVKEENSGAEPAALVRYMECVAHLDEKS